VSDALGTTLTSLPSRVKNWLFGQPTFTKADVPPLQGYPDQSDVANARVNDVSYGSNAAAFVQPPYGGKLPSPRTGDQMEDTFARMDRSGRNPVGSQPVSPGVSDNLMQGYLASQRSALAALGFDPRHMTIGDIPPEKWTVSGSYYPKQDQIVSTGIYPSTTAHESMHRGIEILRQAGMLPPDFDKLSDESSVRAQMLRNYGDVEMGRGKLGDEQVNDGRYYNENRNFAPTMDALEAAAQKLYAKQHPRGPR
jgi:hypothetical protein